MQCRRVFSTVAEARSSGVTRSPTQLRARSPAPQTTRPARLQPLTRSEPWLRPPPRHLTRDADGSRPGGCRVRLWQVRDRRRRFVQGGLRHRLHGQLRCGRLHARSPGFVHLRCISVRSADACHAGAGACGSGAPEIADAASRTVACATGRAARSTASAGTFGVLASFACEASPCAVPTASHAVAEERSGGMFEISDAASGVMTCATGYTASAAATACTLGVLASFACDASLCAVPTASRAVAGVCDMA